MHKREKDPVGSRESNWILSSVERRRDQWERKRESWVMRSAALHITGAVHSEMTYILVTPNILQKQFHVRRRS